MEAAGLNREKIVQHLSGIKEQISFSFHFNSFFFFGEQVIRGRWRGKHTHFHWPDPRASADVENSLGIVQGSKEQVALVDELEHVVLHIQTIKFLLIVWVEVC